MTHPRPAALRIATSGPRIAMICADWHDNSVSQTRTAAFDAINRAAAADITIDAFELPEAADIPLMAKKLARSGRYRALIACGRIASSEPRPPEPGTASMIDRLMRVQLETMVPVFSALLLPREFQSHTENRRFFSDHFIRKGHEVALACLEALAAVPLASRPAAAGPTRPLAA